MFKDLSSFVSALDAAGELKRISARVSPVLEIAQIADEESKSPAPNPPSDAARRDDPRFHSRGGKALLFTNVEGSSIPVLINAWGSYRRMEMALGCHQHLAHANHTPSPRARTPGGFAALAAKIAALTKPEPPKSLSDLITKARLFLPLLRIPPRRRSGRGPCQDIILTGDAIDATRLPILRCWPHDGDFAALGYPPTVNANIPGLSTGPDWDASFRGRYITLAGIHTIHADDLSDPKPASHNIGMYRVQLLGPKSLAMHWHMHHDGARHWRSWKARNQPMPVAIALGGESVMPYAATAPLPPGISELLLAGFLNRRGIPMVRATSVPLWVPANADIIIEGFVSHTAGPIGYDPRDPAAGPLGDGAVFEGPFGDHTGFYSLPDRYPILTITAITHRANPIYPTTIVGLPPQEDYYLGKATERLFLPLLKTIVHDIEDYDLPQFGAFHNCACVRINKSYPLQGRRVMHSVWGAGQMAWTKTIFVVDHDCDVHDTFDVLARAGMWCDPLRDIEFARGPVDILDHAAPILGQGLKLGFDATRKRPSEMVQGRPVLLNPDSTPRPRPIAAPATLHAYEAALRQLPGVAAARVLREARGYWAFIAVRADPTPSRGVRALAAAFALDPSRFNTTNDLLPPFLIAVADTVDITDPDTALFHWVANFDASRDILRFDHPVAPRIGFDATTKSPADARHGEPVRPWPPIIAMDRATIARVDARRAELGLAHR
jgi:4-hydroxy-3-polyprenylbenzoate decarboxylase